MNQENSLVQASNRRSAQQVAASLPRRYLAVLASVAALLILDQAVLQPLLLQVSLYAPTINVAGRQRMLSQRLTKAALIMQLHGDEDELDGEGFREAQRELSLALEQWTRAHHGLLHGDQAMDLPPTEARHIRDEFETLRPHFLAIQSAAQVLARVDPPSTSAESARVRQQAPVILSHEASYLPTMDRIVGLYEQQARRQVFLLRVLGLAVMLGIILLMVALAYLVLRPANRLILQQVRQLEDRVSQRTAELTRINRALQRTILEREQAQQRTQQLSVQLAHASRVTALGQLAAGLAHEINQPLAAINNYAESCRLILDHNPEDARAIRRAMQHIGAAALRAGDIVHRLRNFVRPQSSGSQVTPRVGMDGLIEDVAVLCRFELNGADVALELEQAQGLPAVAVDPICIQQVLVNLIQNSIHALQSSPRNQRRLTVRTSLDDDGNVQVEVSDNGPGFPEEKLDDAFAPFFTTREDGLGMGLAISCSIVQEHRGRLWAENSPSGGAIVRFTLPASHADEAGAQTVAHCVCG